MINREPMGLGRNRGLIASDRRLINSRRFQRPGPEARAGFMHLGNVASVLTFGSLFMWPKAAFASRSKLSFKSLDGNRPFKIKYNTVQLSTATQAGHINQTESRDKEEQM